MMADLMRTMAESSAQIIRESNKKGNLEKAMVFVIANDFFQADLYEHRR